MAFGTPAVISLTCPRCRVKRTLVNIDGGTLYRCAACSFFITLTAVAPTGTASALLALGGTAITVAAGGASFTNGMVLLYDVGIAAEVLTVNGAATATNIPVTAAIKAHLTAVTFGQLSIGLTYGANIAAGYGNIQIEQAQPLSPYLSGG